MKLLPLSGSLGIALLYLISCASPPPQRPVAVYPQPGTISRPHLPNPTIPVSYVPSQPAVPADVGVQFLSLSPMLVTAAGKTLRGSDRPAALPLVNGMVKAPYPAAVAYRDVQVQFSPPQLFANSPVRWTFRAFGGRLRGRLPNGIPLFSTPPGAPVRFDRLDQNGRTTVRVSLPPKGLNRGRVAVVSTVNSQASSAMELAVPAVVVIDPGHGGTTNLAGSSFNNSRTPSGVLEKTLALDYGKELADAVIKLFEERGVPVWVSMTRDRDINVSGRNRAELARNLSADAFVTLHFNGFDGTKRGTLEVQRTSDKGNVNFSEDTTLANRIVQAAVNAFRVFDSNANRRNPVPYATSVSSDTYQGNSAGYHPVRHAYVELDFIDNPAVDSLLTGGNKHHVRVTAAAAMAQAIFADIASHQG